MAQFSNVVIGTSNPVNICDGLPLLPIGAARAGVVAGGNSAPLLSKGVDLALFRMNASAGWGVYLGICGPAVAFLLNTDVTTLSTSAPPGGQVQAKVLSDALEAGWEVGFNLSADFAITADTWHPGPWYSPWKGTWVNSWNQSVNFTFDLINLVVLLIEKVFIGTGKSLLDQVDNFSNNSLTSTWKMVDEQQNQLIAGKGTLSANPSLTLQFNLVPLTANVPVLDLLYAMDQALEATGGYVSFGPSITFEMPVRLTLNDFAIDGATYGGLTYDASTATVTGQGSAPISATAREIAADVSYAAGFSVAVGCYLQVAAFKVFSYELTDSFDVLSLLHLPPPVGSTYHASVCSALANGGQPGCS